MKLKITYFSALHELQDERERVVILIDVDKFDNIWMVYLFEDVNFIDESHPVLFRHLVPKIFKSRWKKLPYFLRVLIATGCPVVLLRPLLTVAKLPLLHCVKHISDLSVEHEIHLLSDSLLYGVVLFQIFPWS